MRALLSAIDARVHNLRYGFLVVPGVVAAVLAAVAPVMVAIDETGGTHGVGIGFHADADAARTVLATIAGSLITVAGLTFSITIVTLQLVSQQFTPRAIRSFLGDRVTQVVVGAFIGTFVYCLLVLRTIRSGSSTTPSFRPRASASPLFSVLSRS